MEKDLYEETEQSKGEKSYCFFVVVEKKKKIKSNIFFFVFFFVYFFVQSNLTVIFKFFLDFIIQVGWFVLMRQTKIRWKRRRFPRKTEPAVRSE